MDMMDDGHQHLHIGCFANQQNHLLSLNLPASTSIYQHLPASTSIYQPLGKVHLQLQVPQVGCPQMGV
jgi:hypothetical protein